jgi:hypothetical protein
LVGLPVNVPVALAAVGALASKTTLSTVSVELPLMLDELRAPTTPVRVAATPPSDSLQSFFKSRFLFGANDTLPGFTLDSVDMAGEAKPGAATTGRWPMLRLLCCI